MLLDFMILYLNFNLKLKFWGGCLEISDEKEAASEMMATSCRSWRVGMILAGRFRLGSGPAISDVGPTRWRKGTPPPPGVCGVPSIMYGIRAGNHPTAGGTPPARGPGHGGSHSGRTTRWKKTKKWIMTSYVGSASSAGAYRVWAATPPWPGGPSPAFQNRLAASQRVVSRHLAPSRESCPLPSLCWCHHNLFPFCRRKLILSQILKSILIYITVETCIYILNLLI